jgi:hypothetical protein
MSKTYISTHIRLNAPGYRRNNVEYHQSIGWQNDADSKAFSDELLCILGGLGFTVQGERSAAISSCGACPTVERGKESLYLHPDDLSGWLAEGSVGQIVEALKAAKTCELRWVDEYERKVDCTLDEYTTELARHEDVIRERWLERLTTPSRRKAYVRRTANIGTNDLINPMDQVGDYQARNSLEAAFRRACDSVVGPILDRLIIEGLVECVVGSGPTREVYVRTRGKTELAALRRTARKAPPANPAGADLFAQPA